MAVDPLITWQTTFAALPQVADNSYAANIAEWYGLRVAGIESNPAQFTTVGFAFSFAESVFATQLLNLGPTVNNVEAINDLADAWQTAINASTISVSSGSCAPPCDPDNTFSVVSSTSLDAASVTAGRTKILDLLTATPVINALDSEFPEVLRSAILLLTFTVDGLDSDPDGPKPLIVSNVGLI